MANMVLGMIIMGKRYNAMKYLSVIMISIGIAVCTIASSNEMGVSRLSVAHEVEFFLLNFFIDAEEFLTCS